MKNTRSYRLAALLLAVMMMIGILPVTAFAGVDIRGEGLYDGSCGDI